jgi:hypothetical protein
MESKKIFIGVGIIVVITGVLIGIYFLTRKCKCVKQQNVVDSHGKIVPEEGSTMVCNKKRCVTDNLCRPGQLGNGYWIQVGGNYIRVKDNSSWYGGQSGVGLPGNQLIWSRDLDTCKDLKSKVFGYHKDPSVKGYGYIGNSDTKGPRCSFDSKQKKYWFQLGGDFENAYLIKNNDGTYSPWLGYGYSEKMDGLTVPVYDDAYTCQANSKNHVFTEPV